MKHFLPAAPFIVHRQGDPLAEYERWRGEQAGGEGLLLVDFELRQYWLPKAPPVSLTALYCLSGERLRVAVTGQALVAAEATALSQFTAWTGRHRLASWEPGMHLELLPETVPKPWGREIWYSGVEQRGVCNLASAAGRSPIPWLQAVVPQGRLGMAGEPLVLLKILDPYPQPVLGDLYFELHEEKREVYVVTGVDSDVWPSGEGGIRLGFDPRRLAAYPGEQAFRQAYLRAVQDYEGVRRELDGLAQLGLEPGQAQLQRERTLREAMDDFTCLKPVRVGDVVSVPLRVPHSLQHGVRTIEFQTPVYERKILSFAQQVQTQDHWDTAEAVQSMLLRAPPQPDFPLLLSEQGLRMERVVDFPDFEVRRITLAGGARLEVEARDSYALLMVVAGALQVAGACYREERALLLPRGWAGVLDSAQAAQPLVLLWALPRGQVVEQGPALWQNLRPCDGSQ